MAFTMSPPLERFSLVVLADKWAVVNTGGGGGGVLPEKLGGGVRPASQSLYPIYDQNLRYSLPYLWPDF